MSSVCHTPRTRRVHSPKLEYHALTIYHFLAKATDENLTSENWEYIMDVCDKVQNEDSGGKDAVASMIKRLAHRNANVQLYTLEVRYRN